MDGFDNCLGSCQLSFSEFTAKALKAQHGWTETTINILQLTH